MPAFSISQAVPIPSAPEAHAEASNGHWGLKNMRERAEDIGGRLGITSRPGDGTSIELMAPL